MTKMEKIANTSIGKYLDPREIAICLAGEYINTIWKTVALATKKMKLIMSFGWVCT